MADELEGVIRGLSEEQRRELVSQYWDSEYGVRACRDLLLRISPAAGGESGESRASKSSSPSTPTPPDD